MNEPVIPVLLDTDIGSDIDDAVALAYLLKQPRCELLGITTVTGEPMVRARLADAVCWAFSRPEVPIYSGCARPLLGPQSQPEAPQKRVLSKWSCRESFEPNRAIEFLRQTIRSRPGEITLLSIGPLTNIGLLFALDPEIPSLLKKYVVMGGLYTDQVAGRGRLEWNARGDAYASAIVFAADVPNMHCVGLEVTCRCRMEAGECRRRFNKGPMKIVGEMAEVWFEHGSKQIVFHDPLATACVFEPSLCTFQPGLVEIELQSERLRGLTYFSGQAEGAPHHVAVDVDVGAFFRHYFETVEGSGQ